MDRDEEEDDDDGCAADADLDSNGRTCTGTFTFTRTLTLFTDPDVGRGRMEKAETLQTSMVIHARPAAAAAALREEERILVKSKVVGWAGLGCFVCRRNLSGTCAWCVVDFLLVRIIFAFVFN